MKIQKFLVLALVLMLAFTFTACGQKVEDINPYANYDLSQNITLPDYMSYEFTKPEVEVTDDQVQDEIEKRLAENPETEMITSGTVEKGDYVYVTYEGTYEDENGVTQTADSLNYTDFLMQLGSTGFIDGFEEALYGAEIGNPVQFDLKIPDGFELDPTIAGKLVHFTVSITSKVIPKETKLTEEFIKKDSEEKATNEEEYREFIKSALYDEAYENALYEAQNELWEKIAGNTEIKAYIDEELEKDADNLMAYYHFIAMTQQKDWEDFLKEEVQITEDGLRERCKAYSESTEVNKMIIYQLAKNLGVTCTQAEYDEKLLAYANYMGFETKEDFNNAAGITIEQYCESYGILHNLYLDKVLNALTEKLSA